jgi:hypothetical protein
MRPLRFVLRTLAIIAELFAAFYFLDLCLIRIDNDEDRDIVTHACQMVLLLFPLTPLLWHAGDEKRGGAMLTRPIVSRPLIAFGVACFLVFNRYVGEGSRIRNTFPPAPSPSPNGTP